MAFAWNMCGLVERTDYFVDGFAVDNLERIYIAKLAQIDVYQDGQQVNKINGVTGNGYKFIIQGDSILLNDANTLYTLDFEGRILKEEPIGQTQFEILDLANEMRAPKQVGNDTFVPRWWLGGFSITRIHDGQSEIIYQYDLPARRILLVGMVGCAAICGVLFLIRLFRGDVRRKRHR